VPHHTCTGFRLIQVNQATAGAFNPPLTLRPPTAVQKKRGELINSPPEEIELEIFF